MLRRRLLAVLVLLSPLAACAGSGGIGLRADSASERLYRSRCSSCHSLPDPLGHSRADWQAVLPRMADRAHLEPEEREAIYDFLLGSRLAGAPGTVTGAL